MSKTNIIKKSGFLQLFTRIGRKIFQQIGWVIVVGFALLIVDNFYLNKICKTVDKLSDSNKSNDHLCMLTPFMGNMGSNFVEIAVVIWFFEIGARREMLAEIQGIFERILNSKEVTNHVKGVYQKREEYSRIIEDSFRVARSDQTIRMLGLFDDVHLLQIRESDIRSKVCSGCHLQILVLHPKSSLLNCLGSIGFILPPEEQTSRTVHGSLPDRLSRLANQLQRERTNGNLKGELEIRVHNNLFSSIGYYSDSVDNRLIWMYFSDPYDGIEYPALHIINQSLIKDADDHFENLWDKSTGDGVLLKVTNKGTINRISEIFPDEGKRNFIPSMPNQVSSNDIQGNFPPGQDGNANLGDGNSAQG